MKLVGNLVKLSINILEFLSREDFARRKEQLQEDQIRNVQFASLSVASVQRASIIVVQRGLPL